MSLINDALKKAQNIQTRTPSSGFPRPTLAPRAPATPAPVTDSAIPQANGPTANTAPATATAPATTASAAAPVVLAPSSTKSRHNLVVMVIAGLVLLLATGAISYVVYALVFTDAPGEQTAANPPPAASAPTSKAPTATVAPTETAPAVAETPAVAAPARATPAPAVAPAPAPEKEIASQATAPATPSQPAAPAPAPVAAVVSPTSVVAAPAEIAAQPNEEELIEEEFVEERINNPDPKIQAWVDKISVSGIRPGENAKALMNDRVYVIGDIVNREFKLRLLEIHDRILVFEDPLGNTYEYSF